MNLPRRETRVLLLHEFHLRRRATEATSHIYNTMGKNNVFSICVRHNIGSIALKISNLELGGLPCCGQLLEPDIYLLKQLIEEELQLTSPHLAEQPGCSSTAVEKHLNELGRTWRYEVWIPHELLSR